MFGGCFAGLAGMDDPNLFVGFGMGNENHDGSQQSDCYISVFIIREAVIRTGFRVTVEHRREVAEIDPVALKVLPMLLSISALHAYPIPIADPLPEDPDGDYELETGDRTLAKADPGRETAHPVVSDTPQSGPQHGFRGGAGGREDVGS